MLTTSGVCATLSEDRGAPRQQYPAIARSGGRQGRGGKGPLPKSPLWQAVGWQIGEYPPCCRRNAESYPPTPILEL